MALEPCPCCGSAAPKAKPPRAKLSPEQAAENNKAAKLRWYHANKAAQREKHMAASRAYYYANREELLLKSYIKRTLAKEAAKEAALSQQLVAEETSASSEGVSADVSGNETGSAQDLPP